MLGWLKRQLQTIVNHVIQPIKLWHGIIYIRSNKVRYIKRHFDIVVRIHFAKMVIYGIPHCISNVLTLHPATLCGFYKCNIISGELSNLTWNIFYVPMLRWVIIWKPNLTFNPGIFHTICVYKWDEASSFSLLIKATFK